jgi:hypothetical protein
VHVRTYDDPTLDLQLRSVPDTIDSLRLDEEKLEALRSWGERLRQTGGAESAAVGRAILMLVEEIDRLHIDLWNARVLPVEEAGSMAPETVAPDDEPVETSLYGRLRRALGASGDSSEAPQAVETAGDTQAVAWIDGMRHPD